MSPCESFNVEAFGVIVKLDLNGEFSQEAISAIHEAWKDARVDGSRVPDGVVNVSMLETLPFDDLLEGLSVRVTLKALECRGGEALLFHAAGIAAPDGRVLAFVGPSGRGKTTISRNLAKRYGYVSDETIGVGFDLEVRPYRKPLSLKRDPRPKEQVAPSALELQELPDVPLQLARLVVLERHSEATAPSVEYMNLLDGLNDVLPETSYLTQVPNPLQQLARVGESTGGILRLHYSEAADLVDFIPTIFETEPSGETWAAAFSGSEEDLGAHPQADSIALGDVIDAIHVDGRTLVLKRDRMAVMLDGVGPGIWDAARCGLTFDETVAHVEELYGAPESADVRGTLDSMISECVDAGILRRG